MIPQLLLEEILAGEKNEKDYYSKYGKEELEKALAELKKSNEEILAAYPADMMHKKIIAKTINGNKKTAKRRSSFMNLKYAAAAVLAFAFISPVILKNFRNPETGTERIKGNADQQLKLYRQDGKEAVLLKNGDTAEENDLIQITYKPGNFTYGIIFSVDGNGNITRHFPENSWEAQKLEKSVQEVPLSSSYQLDDAPDYECFVFAAADKPFDISSIESADRKNYSVDFLEKGSYLPEECEVSTFVLRKK